MRIEMMPTIKLELQHMRHTMLHSLGLVGGKYEKAMDAALEEAINKFDFNKIMTEAATDSIRIAIENYFKYGGKGHRFIQDTINTAFNRMWQEIPEDKENGLISENQNI